MTTIDNTNVKDYTLNGIWTIAGSAKPSKDSPKSAVKNFTLEVTFNEIPVKDCIDKALDGIKIAFANNQFRPNIDKYTNGQVIKVNFTAPGKKPDIDGKTKIIMEARAKGIDVTDPAELAKYVAETFNITL